MTRYGSVNLRLRLRFLLVVHHAAHEPARYEGNHAEHQETAGLDGSFAKDDLACILKNMNKIGVLNHQEVPYYDQGQEKEHKEKNPDPR